MDSENESKHMVSPKPSKTHKWFSVSIDYYFGAEIRMIATVGNIVSWLVNNVCRNVEGNKNWALSSTCLASVYSYIYNGNCYRLQQRHKQHYGYQLQLGPILLYYFIVSSRATQILVLKIELKHPVMCHSRCIGRVTRESQS